MAKSMAAVGEVTVSPAPIRVRVWKRFRDKGRGTNGSGNAGEIRVSYCGNRRLLIREWTKH